MDSVLHVGHIDHLVRTMIVPMRDADQRSDCIAAGEVQRRLQVSPRAPADGLNLIGNAVAPGYINQGIARTIMDDPAARNERPTADADMLATTMVVGVSRVKAHDQIRRKS